MGLISVLDDVHLDINVYDYDIKLWAVIYLASRLREILRYDAQLLNE